MKKDENQPAQIAHHSHHHSHAKKKKATKDVKKDDAKDDLKKKEKEEHNFFPSDNNEMNDADYDSWTDYSRSTRRNRNNNSWSSRSNRNFDTPSSRSYQKRNGNASQKRQNQRDTRRFKDNPNRSQREEQNERNRKSRQARRSGNACRDPSEPGCGGNDNFPRNREAKRNVNCRARDAGCNYHRVSPGNEPNRNRRDRDIDCLDDCYRRANNRNQEERCDRTCAMDSMFSITEFKNE